MDSGKIVEILIITLVQLVGVVVYVVITRERLNYVLKRMDLFEVQHKEHYAHAAQDERNFGELKSQLAVIDERGRHMEGDISLLRRSFHEIRNAMQVVLGKAAVMGLTPNIEERD